MTSGPPSSPPPSTAEAVLTIDEPPDAVLRSPAAKPAREQDQRAGVHPVERLLGRLPELAGGDGRPEIGQTPAELPCLVVAAVGIGLARPLERAQTLEPGEARRDNPPRALTPDVEHGGDLAGEDVPARVRV